MTADTVGGVWTYALELSRALAPHGIKIALATMGALPTEAQKAEAEAIANLRVYASSFMLEWMEDPWQDVQAAGERLLDLERLVKPDIVHLNGYAHGTLDWQAPVMVVAHSCVLSWWRAVKKETAPANWDSYRQEVGRGIRAAGMLVAPTRAMLEAIQKEYSVLPPSRVIPNGRDASRFERSHKEKIIFSAGRLWDEAKNLAALERIAPELPWEVYVAGEQRHPDGRLTRPGNLHTLGCLSNCELAKWLAKASIYALPARYEPFGLSVLEAALCECALVLGDIASLRENWQDAALFVPPDDSHALGAVLEHLIQDTTLRKAMAARARFRALELTPERMAAGYLAAYAELMENAVPTIMKQEQTNCAS